MQDINGLSRSSGIDRVLACDDLGDKICLWIHSHGRNDGMDVVISKADLVQALDLHSIDLPQRKLRKQAR
jgi:hypothetical protein